MYHQSTMTRSYLGEHVGPTSARTDAGRALHSGVREMGGPTPWAYIPCATDAKVLAPPCLVDEPNPISFLEDFCEIWR